MENRNHKAVRMVGQEALRFAKVPLGVAAEASDLKALGELHLFELLLLEHEEQASGVHGE